LILIPEMAEIWFVISARPVPLATSAMTSTLTVHCKWEDETAREQTAHSPLYAEAKKMKSLILHTRGCPRNCSSISSSRYAFRLL